MVDNIDKVFAKYYTFTDDEKDAWWQEHVSKSYKDVELKIRLNFEHASRNTDRYLQATPEERKYLWSMYDYLTRTYCDGDRWATEFHKEERIRHMINRIYPDEDVEIKITKKII